MSRSRFTIADDNRVRRRISAAVGQHASLEAAMVAGVYVTAAWDWADIQCLGYAERLAQTYYNRMAKMSRVEIDDLVSSALQGLHEAIGTFEPRRCEARVSTHISWQIRYRMNEERSRSHWTLQKPPESLEREYMAGRLQGLELEDYLDTYVRSWSIPGEDASNPGWGESTGLRPWERG